MRNISNNIKTQQIKRDLKKGDQKGNSKGDSKGDSKEESETRCSKEYVLILKSNTYHWKHRYLSQTELTILENTISRNNTNKEEKRNTQFHFPFHSWHGNILSTPARTYHIIPTPAPPNSLSSILHHLLDMETFDPPRANDRPGWAACAGGVAIYWSVSAGTEHYWSGEYWLGHSLIVKCWYWKYWLG